MPVPIYTEVWKFQRVMQRSEARWYLSPKILTLTYGNAKTGAWECEVDLESCTTSAQLLDWIFTVNETPFNEPASVIFEFLEAIRKILGPQAIFCRGGEDLGKIDVKKLVAEYVERKYC